MKTAFRSLIEHHEQALDQKLATEKAGPKTTNSRTIPLSNHANDRTPVIKPTYSNHPYKLRYLLINASQPSPILQKKSPLLKILAEDFHANLLQGDPDCFDILIRFLDDQTKFPPAIGLKNYYLRLLKNLPMTHDQAEQVRRLIWNHATSKECHRSTLFCRLAIRVSSPEFHLAVTKAALPENKISEWKLHLLRKYLDNHCPETKPKS